MKELKEVAGTVEEMDAMPKWVLRGFFQMPMLKRLDASSAQKKRQLTSVQKTTNKICI